jgi:hypothetical protein
MKLSDFKSLLKVIDSIKFQLPDNSYVPGHFHVTEVGLITKKFIDCGGVLRDESYINFQLWYSTDLEHKLTPRKLLEIIELSERKIGLQDLPLEVEYQCSKPSTIGKYGLEFENGSFILTGTQTNCLAMDKCGINVEKPRIRLSELTVDRNSCKPGSGCC